MYYRGAHAAILVYDITNEESLADIKVWLDGKARDGQKGLQTPCPELRHPFPRYVDRSYRAATQYVLGSHHPDRRPQG